jgi:uncharacterized membrane protein
LTALDEMSSAAASANAAAIVTAVAVSAGAVNDTVMLVAACPALLLQLQFTVASLEAKYSTSSY